jgi:hypothetical protein
MGDAVLLGHALATFAMTGIIWFVQVVHYPLFRAVGAGGFAGYSAAHARLTTRIVAPPMLLELATGLLLLRLRPADVPLWPPALGLALIAVLWLATAFISVPKHAVLANGFDELAWRSLCAGNWIRTVLWSLRSALVLAMLALALP